MTALLKDNPHLEVYGHKVFVVYPKPEPGARADATRTRKLRRANLPRLKQGKQACNGCWEVGPPSLTLALPGCKNCETHLTAHERTRRNKQVASYLYLVEEQLLKATTDHWNRFAHTLPVPARRDLVDWFAANMSEPRRVSAVEAVKAFRLYTDSPTPAHRATLEEKRERLEEFLPPSYVLDEDSIKKTANASVGHQRVHVSAGRWYDVPAYSPADLEASLVVTNGVCPLSGVILDKVSGDAQFCSMGHNVLNMLPTERHLNGYKGTLLYTASPRSLREILRSNDATARAAVSNVRARFGGGNAVDELDLLSEMVFLDFKKFIGGAQEVLQQATM